MDGTIVSPSGATVEFEPVQNLIPSGGSHPFKLRVWASEAGDWDVLLEIFKDAQRTMSAGSETLKLRVIPPAPPAAKGPSSARRTTPAAPSAPSTPAGILRADANVLVLADTSGSMEGEKIESLRSSVLDFVGRIDDAGEYIGLIDFDDVATETIPLGPFGTDLNRWNQAVEGLDGDGGTAFYDAVSYAISVLESEGASGRANIIIALTDGFDQDSQLTDGEVISQLQGASVPVLLSSLANPCWRSRIVAGNTSCRHSGYASRQATASDARQLVPPAHCLTQIVTLRKWLPQLKCYRKLGRRPHGRRHLQDGEAGTCGDNQGPVTTIFQEGERKDSRRIHRDNRPPP